MKFQDVQVDADLETIHDNYIPVVDEESLQIVDGTQTVLQGLNRTRKHL